MSDAVFQPERLRLARLLAGWSKAELAERLGVSRQFIHALEVGSKAPSRDFVAAAALALQVVPRFFQEDPVPEVREADCHFRSRRDMTDKLAEQIVARGTAVELLVQLLETKLTLPRVDFPSIDARSVDEIEDAAEACRSHWGLGLGPIASMCRLLENAGALVVPFQSDRAEFDALSMARERPIIIRSQLKASIGRLRFDLAHECGHLVIHQGVSTGDKETESQAHRFAAGLLMPRSRFGAEFPQMRGRLDWNALYSLKVRWRVSVKAVIRRGRDLGFLDEVQYAAGNRYLAQSGQTKAERFDDRIPPESPELLSVALKKFSSTYSMSMADIAKSISVTPALLAELVGTAASRVISRPVVASV